MSIETIPISQFKAQCLSILARVKRTGRPVLVTRFGTPVAEVRPPAVKQSKRKLGTMEGTAVIIGDIVGPIADPSIWNVLKK